MKRSLKRISLWGGGAGLRKGETFGRVGQGGMRGGCPQFVAILLSYNF